MRWIASCQVTIVGVIRKSACNRHPSKPEIKSITPNMCIPSDETAVSQLSEFDEGLTLFCFGFTLKKMPKTLPWNETRRLFTQHWLQRCFFSCFQLAYSALELVVWPNCEAV